MVFQPLLNTKVFLSYSAQHLVGQFSTCAPVLKLLSQLRDTTNGGKTPLLSCAAVYHIVRRAAGAFQNPRIPPPALGSVHTA